MKNVGVPLTPELALAGPSELGEGVGRSPVRVSSQRNMNQISPFLCDYGVALLTPFSRRASTRVS